jgi:protein-tyrosine phosphatase
MMVDLHCHVLPAIDDGSESMEQSVEFCRVALEDGVTTLVATPHQKPGQYDNPPESIRQKVLELRAVLEEAGVGVEVLEGAEVYLTADLSSRLQQRQVTTLGATGRYLLLELPYQQMPWKVEESVFQLKLAGVTPVIAHPERINYFVSDMERLSKLVRLGCLTQLTGAALLGGFGEKARDFSFRMLERDLVHVIASDSHDTIYRPPVLSRARDAAAEIVGPEKAAKMVTEVPQAICRGAEWEPWDLPPEPAPAPEGLMERLRSLFRGKE